MSGVKERRVMVSGGLAFTHTKHTGKHKKTKYIEKTNKKP